MKNLYNKLGVILMIKGSEIKSRMIEKLQDNKGSFFTDHAIAIVATVVIGIFIFMKIAFPKLQEIFTKAFDNVDVIYTP